MLSNHKKKKVSRWLALSFSGTINKGHANVNHLSDCSRINIYRWNWIRPSLQGKSASLSVCKEGKKDVFYDAPLYLE